MSLAAAGHSQPLSPVTARMPQHHHSPAYQPAVAMPQKLGGVSTAEWEAILGSMDSGHMNMFDGIYGGTAAPLSLVETPVSTTSNPGWPSPDSWDLASISIADLGGAGGPGAGPQSVLSLSDDNSLSSGDDVSPAELGLATTTMEYRNAMLVAAASNDNFLLDGLEHFGL